MAKALILILILLLYGCQVKMNSPVVFSLKIFRRTPEPDLVLGMDK